MFIVLGNKTRGDCKLNIVNIPTAFDGRNNLLGVGRPQKNIFGIRVAIGKKDSRSIISGNFSSQSSPALIVRILLG